MSGTAGTSLVSQFIESAFFLCRPSYFICAFYINSELYIFCWLSIALCGYIFLVVNLFYFAFLLISSFHPQSLKKRGIQKRSICLTIWAANFHKCKCSFEKRKQVKWSFLTSWPFDVFPHPFFRLYLSGESISMCYVIENIICRPTCNHASTR